MKIFSLITSITFLVIMTSSCTPIADGPYQALEKVDQGKAINREKEVASCEVDYNEYELDVNILAYEIVSKKGFSFGFNILNQFFKAFGIKFKTEKGQVVVSMGLSDVLSPNEDVAYVQGRGFLKKKDFSFMFDPVKLSVDMSYYKQTPLSKLSQNAVNDTFNKLRAEMDQHVIGWKSKIVYEDHGFFVMPAGSVSGVRVGDRFTVTNVDHLWKGEPCESELLMVVKKGIGPTAKLEAIQVEGNASLLRIVERSTDEQVLLGAMVLADQELWNSERRLSWPIRLRNLSSEPLILPGNESLDLRPYIQESLKALGDHHGFHFKK